MHTTLHFRVLGVVEVESDAGYVPLSGKQRSLLAVLLLKANTAVTNSRLMNAVWDAPLPAAPETRVRTLVSELRRALTVYGGAAIETKPSAYVLRTPDERVDLRMFECRVAQARKAAADALPQSAITRYDEALALWQGSALTGASGPFAEAEAARLEELRLSVQEERFEMLLDAGRPADVVADLSQLVEQYPLREGMHAQLMTALHRCGRRDEALACYHRLRSRLVRELGMEPLVELRQLQEQILNSASGMRPAPGVRTPQLARSWRR